MSIAIGIDLGTTNTVVAALRGEEPEVVRTSENLDYIPSVVCFDSNIQEIYIGRQALEWIEEEPENGIYSIKRLMGMLYYDDATIEKRQQQEDIQKFEAIKAKVGYKIVPEANGVDDGVRVVLGGKEYRPEDISAMILRRAKEEAERHFGEQVNGAIITVPAYFEEKQKSATLRAGKLAGLDVLALLEEPTAAAIAAGSLKPQNNHYVLVYDLGGGTFDLSLLQVHQQNYHVRDTGGNNWLGGDDFDQELIRMVADRIKAEHHYDPMNDNDFRARVKPLVEAAKITLSDSTEAIINAPNCCTVPIDNNPNRRKRVSVHGLTVTREQYESRIEKYVTESLERVQEILRRTQTPANLLDVVLLVGGATMTPCVRAAVDRVFPGKLRPIGELNPMTCVAQGAALWAAEKQKVMSDPGRPVGSKLEVKGRTERAIGIAVGDGHSSDGFEVIIPRGTLLPMEPIERRFIALQPDRINVPIYAGERAHASENRFQGNIRLDLNELGGQPLVPGTPVTVRLKITENKIMEVIIHAQGRNAITRGLDYADTACGVDEWQEEQEELEQMIMMADRFLPEYGPFVDEATRKQIEVLVERANKVLGDATPNRREARLLTKRIYRGIIYSDTLGGLLFQAEYLAGRPEMEPDLVTRLGSLCAIAKTIYRENLSQPTPAKANDLHQIRKGLEVLVNRAMRTLRPIDKSDSNGGSTLGKLDAMTGGQSGGQSGDYFKSGKA